MNYKLPIKSLNGMSRIPSNENFYRCNRVSRVEDTALWKFMADTSHFILEGQSSCFIYNKFKRKPYEATGNDKINMW